MLLTRNSVELLAPVGTWDVLETVIEAGADAVYLGGKRFNMRMHRTDANFDDKQLAEAINYAHARNVRVYITINNLINVAEIDKMEEYLSYLNTIQPDALIVQDLALIELSRKINSSIPLHASVMMNTHNEHAVRTLQEYGITRVVTNREMSLEQLRYLRERTGIELEYFIHGDMCIAHSGQCLHSGILFGQSSNRGRCLKPCRWPYKLVDADSGQEIPGLPGPYVLALKDMCMYRHIPELIQAGVCSFKIEGRMRTADFLKRIVATYRRAIDSYISDPTGYTINETDWNELYQSRARDFTTCYALGKPGASAIGYSGEREPRFFSQAVKEAGIAKPSMPQNSAVKYDRRPSLAVRVADLDGLTAACKNGADITYVAGEAFLPNKPWTLKEIEKAIEIAGQFGTQVIVTTPRITMERECGELEQFFTKINELKPSGLMVGNIGSLRLARQTTDLPVQTDFSFNVFNHLAVNWLKAQGVIKATISPEATHDHVIALNNTAQIPLELIVHGPIEAMVLEHCIPDAVLDSDKANCHRLCANKRYALLDTAGQYHPILIDQYCRNHILFTKDLCLLPYLATLFDIGNFRIEGQHYTPDLVGTITGIYRRELDSIYSNKSGYMLDSGLIEKIEAISPREVGIGSFRYRISR